MSTNPYAMHGGLRIRQSYNKALLRYRAWFKGREPVGADIDEWNQWRQWTRDREAQLLATRDKLVAAAEDKTRRKLNERKRDRRSLSTRGA